MTDDTPTGLTLQHFAWIAAFVAVLMWKPGLLTALPLALVLVVAYRVVLRGPRQPPSGDGK